MGRGEETAMTGVLDRSDTATAASEVRVEQAADRVWSAPGWSARIALAALSAGAGVIHLAMVPSHWGESVAEGLGFAAVGWLQVAFAVVVLARPTRGLLRAAVVVNLAAIGGWIVSRVWGLPFGAHSGHAEDAGFVDLTCVGFEVALVIACIVLAARPRGAGVHGLAGYAVAAIVGVGVVGLATAALASPGARDHAAHSHGLAGSGGHVHGGQPAVDDKGFSLIHNGQHDHHMIHTLDAPTQHALDAQLAVTRELAARTPTVADAQAQGYSRVGPYFPGIGAHYMRGYGDQTTNPDGVIDGTDLRNPLMLIFDGTQPTSRIAGFMYYSVSPSEPAGFPGRNDTWHYHESICVKFNNGAIDIPFGLDHAATEEQCASVGGEIYRLTQYMAHVWSVPGFEMTDEYGGVFGELNPKLACADGTYYMLPVEEWAAHPLNVCRAQ
jgi:hypothetical protein